MRTVMRRRFAGKRSVEEKGGNGFGWAGERVWATMRSAEGAGGEGQARVRDEN